MEMTAEEIVRHYNQASNKSKDIKVLADLNCVSPGEIRKVLAESGVAGVEMPRVIRYRKPAPALPEPEGQKSARRVPDFWERMEAILSALPENLPPAAEGIVQNLLQTLFADYLEQRLGRGAVNPHETDF